MTFDQAIFLWCALVPGLVAGAAAVASRARLPGRGMLPVIGWWLAVAVAMAGCQGWQWWPDDAWRQAVWPLAAWVVLASAAATLDEPDRESRSQPNDWRWVIAGVLACLTALVAMPGSEQWSDRFHLHRIWMFAVATSCLVNSFAIQCMARRGAERWCLLVALAGLGGPMALAASSYGSLAQWTLAVIVATTATAVPGIAGIATKAWVTSMPVVAAAAGITAAGRFYSYEDHAAWIYALMLYGPALAAVVDFPMRPLATWLRVTISGLVSLAMVILVAWAVLLS